MNATVPHPFYLKHRDQMAVSMQQRLDLVDDLLRSHAAASDLSELKREVMGELDVVIGQMPFVGGDESRMSDFFMRFAGFFALGRVLRRHAVPAAAIAMIGRESLRRQLLATPEGERLEAGRTFMSAANQAHIRTQADLSREGRYAEDFVYDYVAPGPGDDFEFGIDYKACGFCKMAARHGDNEHLPALCGLDFVAYELRGIELQRTKTLAGGASHCNFRFKRRPEIT